MPADDIPVEEEIGEIVQWYDRRPLAVPAAVVTGSVIAAFAVGALVAVGVLALAGRLRD